MIIFCQSKINPIKPHYLNNPVKKIAASIICIGSLLAEGQSPAFYHLSTAEGLSDNNVKIARRDRNGVLWIGTSEGLNSFDGNSITTYYKYDYPELPDNDIELISIDHHNRVWLSSGSSQLAMLDDKRRFHSFEVGDTAGNTQVTNLFNTAKWGVIALKGNRHYVWKDPNKKVLEELRFAEDSLLPSRILFSNPIGDDKIMYYGENRLLVVDYSSLKVLLNMPFKGLFGGAAINRNELIVYPIGGEPFYRINIAEGRIMESYKGLRDQHNHTIAGNLRNMVAIGGNKFVITTRFSGAYMLDLSQKSLQHWFHDPLDMRSIGGNNTFRIHYDSSGYLFITTQTSGLHYYNTKLPVASSRSYFTDEAGEVFDGYIQSITTDNAGTLWLGAQDRLIKWDRKRNATSFIKARLPDGTSFHGSETIRAVHVDEQGNLWVGTTRYGILVLDKQYKTIAQLTSAMPGGQSSLPSNWINDIGTDMDGNTWVATLRGICIIEKGTGRIRDLSTHPVLSQLENVHCIRLWFDKSGRAWIGSTRGAWCYDPAGNTLRHYDMSNGLPHNTIFCINEDASGSIYLGSRAGLSVLGKDEKIFNYNRSGGLRNDRCEDILADDKGYLWIGNLNCILRFDPVNKTFSVFEEGHGFSHAGFRMRVSHKADDGEMFWGSDKGLIWFYPKQLSTISVMLLPVINALSTGDTVYRFTGPESLSFPYNVSPLSFHFASGELSGGKKSHFLYRLAGLEDEWKSPAVTGQVAYSKLPPGHYRFEVKASRDGVNWFEGLYPVEINIARPWWQQNWFRGLYIAFFLTLSWLFYRYIQKRKKANELQKIIDYFANSGYEHSSVDDILWDIARNCVSRLEFEDCVIYLLDEERNVLVQKAAYGPKSPKGFEIANPIDIPVGSGIVGHVAQTGQAEIIRDTTKDSRYIVDDEHRLSEITVPIIHEGKVIGLIDSENRQKNFFNGQHLKALKAIASLCSAKISRAMAMDAMKKSKTELMELNMKMAEAKFLNLRLQMNPHFLFNSLSSIQHLIVSQQTTKAYKYLTVFSNFLRSLLHYAEMNFIPLDEELKILRMYIELESLRFDQTFQYDIVVDEGLYNDEVLVPSLMVQPFAENAIWHGLLHKEGEKNLTIEFLNQSEEYLTCVIKDNGVGRENASRIKEGNLSARVHESKGIHIIRERLELLQKKTGKPAHVKIDDLYDAEQQPAGTRVSITIPYYNPEET